jgi:hypothetical protein
MLLMHTHVFKAARAALQVQSQQGANTAQMIGCRLDKAVRTLEAPFEAETCWTMGAQRMIFAMKTK